MVLACFNVPFWSFFHRPDCDLFMCFSHKRGRAMVCGCELSLLNEIGPLFMTHGQRNLVDQFDAIHDPFCASALAA